jgi:hypothetical protein
MLWLLMCVQFAVVKVLAAVCTVLCSESTCGLLLLLQGKLFIGGVEADTISKDQLVEYCSQW